MLVWPRCCGFAEAGLNACSIMQQKDILIWGPKLLQRSFLKLPSKCKLWLGHAAWEVQNIASTISLD